MTLAAAIGAVAIAAQPAGVDAEQRLEAAGFQEIVRGDLKGAIARYRGLLAAAGTPRGVAARALLRMGESQERLGQPEEARGAYARVLREYRDQTEVVALARAHLAGRQEAPAGPRNLNFQQGAPGKAPPGWSVASPTEAGYEVELRRQGCRGAGCAVVSVPANTLNGIFAILSQSFSAAGFRGKTVRLRAWVRLEPTDPGDYAQMRLSVDRANRPSGFLVLNSRDVRTPEWTRCEIVSQIYEDAAFINLGVVANGRGRVWVDGVTFEVISKNGENADGSPR